MGSGTKRDLIILSGYYGFANLGDEAILEEIIEEVKQFVGPEKIYVLSNNPQNTARTFGVKAVSRWKLGALLSLLPQTKLLISGGGGLFQDVSSFRPPLFYGTQIALARLYGSEVFIFAQGIGPLKSAVNKALTKGALALAQVITVRDIASETMLRQWGYKCELTADPVWLLKESALPKAVADRIERLSAITRSSQSQPTLIGLSLRQSANWTQADLEQLVASLDDALPPEAQILLLPLQREKDLPELEKFQQLWRKRGRSLENFYPADLDRPSQWLSLIGKLDLLIGMRLHALVMALKSGVPVIGLAYDPKVSQLLRDFEQPVLSLDKTAEDSDQLSDSWTEIVKQALSDIPKLSEKAAQKAVVAKNLAGQNFVALSKILGR